MKKLVIGGVPKKSDFKIKNAQQVLQLERINKRYKNPEKYIILEEIGLKPTQEFLDYCTDNITVYSKRMPNKTFKKNFDEIIDEREKSFNFFKAPSIIRKAKFEQDDAKVLRIIKKAKAPSRILIKQVLKGEKNPTNILKLGEIDKYDRLELLVLAYKK